jgi:hypothetical protein
MATVYKCSKCGSKRLFNVRIDSDWGNGGDFTRVNENEYYESSDPESYDHIDISFTICLECYEYDSAIPDEGQ